MVKWIEYLVPHLHFQTLGSFSDVLINFIVINRFLIGQTVWSVVKRLPDAVVDGWISGSLYCDSIWISFGDQLTILCTLLSLVLYGLGHSDYAPTARHPQTLFPNKYRVLLQRFWNGRMSFYFLHSSPTVETFWKALDDLMPGISPLSE